MNVLEEIVAEAKKLKPILKESLTQGDFRTLNSKRGRQARAVERMKELTEEYALSLRSAAVYILPLGDQKEAFVKAIASMKKFPGFISDPEQFYKDLANQIDPQMYRTGSSNLLDILTRVLENKMLDLNVQSYYQLIFKGKFQRPIKGKEDMLQFVKDVINDQVGSEIAAEDAIRRVTPKGLEKGYKEVPAKILLASLDEKLTLDLFSSIKKRREDGSYPFTKHVYLVIAGKTTQNVKGSGIVTISEVNADNVKEALKAIDNMVGGKS